MQIKTFLGKDAQTVLAQVKAELGPEAVILTSKDVSKGSVRLHEVTAGIDYNLTETALPEKGNGRAADFGVFGAFSGPDLFARGPALTPAPEHGHEALALPEWRQWHKDWSSLREHILALLKPELRLESLTPRQRLALEFLQKEGVDDEVIISLYRSLLQDPEKSVLQPLSDLLRIKPWGFKCWTGKIHALAGPHGAGKTTTALRMLMALKEEKPALKMAIINADCERGQGRLILKHYCDLLDIAYCEAVSADELAEALKECKDAERVIIDLPGLSRDQTLTGLLQHLALPAKAGVHLVLSPYYSSEHLRGLLAIYTSGHAARQMASIVWTKLDEAFSFGAIANAAAFSNLPVSAVSFAPGLTGSLLPAEETALWRMLFKHKLPGHWPQAV